MIPAFTKSKSGIFRVLAASGVQLSHTGNTDETALASITIPAGAMGPNGVLRVTSLWSYTNSGNNKNLRVRLGGLAGTQYTGITATTTATLRHQCQIHNRNAANSQVGVTGSLQTYGTNAAAITTSAINTAADAVLAFTAQLASAGETISLESYLVELLYRP
jgi:hypothetical protein